MAGFMAGFGEAFSRQIEKGQDRRAQARRDAFQIAYDSYLRKKDEYEEDKEEDTRRINSAKAITASVPGAPEAAWEHAYQWLTAGYTPGQVEEKIRTTTFASQQTPAMSDTAQNAQTVAPVTTPTRESIEQQTAESGLVPGQEDTVGQQNPDLLGSLFGQDGLFNPEAAKQRRMDRAQGAVMDATGVSQEEFDQINSGFQPHQMSGNAPEIVGTAQEPISLENFNDEALWVQGTRPDGTPFSVQALPDGNGGYIGADQQPIEGEITRVMSVEEQKAYFDALKYVNENTAALRDEKVSVIQMANEGLDMVELVRDNRNVLTATSKISTVLNDISNELASVVDQTQGIFSPELQAAEQRAIEQTAQAFESVGVDSSDANMFASMRIKFVFSLARTMSGSGPLTAADIADASKVLNTSDPAEFERQMQGLITNAVENYDHKASTIMEMDLGVAHARTQGVPVDSLFGPILEDLGEEQQTFLEQNTDPNRQEGPTQDNNSQGQGEVLEEGIVNEDLMERFGLTDPSLLGKKYRLYQNGLDIEE